MEWDSTMASGWRQRGRAWFGRRLAARRSRRLGLLRVGRHLRRVSAAGAERLCRWGIAVGAVVLMVCLAWPAAAFSSGQRRVLDAIVLVESGGRDDVADGDGGKAIGPYQIHRVYWLDAVAGEPALGPEAGYDYQDCRRREYAERVVAAYMRKWVPEAWAAADAEVIARTHNGGPRGAAKEATRGYWRKVATRLRP